MIRFSATQMIAVILLILGALSSGCSDARKTANKVGEDVVIHSPERALELKLHKDLQTINRAIQVFQAANGRYPNSLQELAEKGVLSRIPKEPFGGEWNYDPGTGTVTSSSHPEFGTSEAWN